MAFANYTVALSFDQLVNQGIGYQIGLPPSAAGVRSLPAVPSAGRMVFVSVHEETGNALPVGGSYRLVFYACAPTQLALSRAERAGTLFFDETIAAVSTGTYAADFTQIAPGAESHLRHSGCRLHQRRRWLRLPLLPGWLRGNA